MFVPWPGLSAKKKDTDSKEAHLPRPRQGPGDEVCPVYSLGVNRQGPVLGHIGKDFHFLSAEIVPFPI